MKQAIDPNAKPHVSVNLNSRDVRIDLVEIPDDIEKPCRAALNAWQRDFEKRIAGLAKLPQMALVRTLRARRDAASRTIDSLTARIDSAKADAFSAAPEQIEAAVAKVADTITTLESQISAARLAVEACDRALPEAVAARAESFRTALVDLTNEISAEMQAAFAAERVKFWGKIGDHVQSMLIAEAKAQTPISYQQTTPDTCDEWAVRHGVVAA